MAEESQVGPVLLYQKMEGATPLGELMLEALGALINLGMA